MLLLTTAATTAPAAPDHSVEVALITGTALVIGALLAVITSWLTAWQTARATAKRQAASRLAADQRESRRFQRDNLLAIQPALMRYVRAIGKIWVADQAAMKAIGQATQMGPELDQESYAARVELGFLIERVADDDLRASLERLIAVEAWMIVPQTKAELDDGMKRFNATIDGARGALGVVLRGLLAP